MADVKRVAFDFVDRLRDCASVDELGVELFATSRSLGYDHVSIFELPSATERLDERVMLSNWPTGWIARYRGGNYARFDPVLRRARRAVKPFEWSEAPYCRDDPDAVRVMSEAKYDFGLVEGLTVPMSSDHGTHAIVSFGARHSDGQADYLPALYIVATYAHCCLTAIQHARRTEQQSKFGPKLSPREIECLKWTAHGKTAWEIGMILSLAERTVREYIDSAAKKLCAVNRSHAVAEAIRRNIIF